VVEVLGAILLRNAFKNDHAAAVESLDVDKVTERFSDDVTLTFMGNPPIVGKEAVKDFMREYFATLAGSKTTTTHVAVARPWAFGLTNTVLVEDDVELTRKDGSIDHLPQGLAFDVHSGRVVAVREYLADPAARKRALGE
jgi:ketosteroid isomerase-like protein